MSLWSEHKNWQGLLVRAENDSHGTSRGGGVTEQLVEFSAQHAGTSTAELACVLFAHQQEMVKSTGRCTMRGSLATPSAG